ncbi:MAG: hypothetical protein ABEH38_09950 [Flavobacteriales bacterium]
MKASYPPFLILLILFQFGCKPTAELKEGSSDISYLKGLEVLPVKVVYEDFYIAKKEELEHEKDLKEEKFLKERVKRSNEDKPGAGDAFKKKWHRNKKNGFKERFMKAMKEATKGMEPRIVPASEFAKELKDHPYAAYMEVRVMDPGIYFSNDVEDRTVDLRSDFVIKDQKKGKERTVLRHLYRDLNENAKYKKPMERLRDAFEEAGEHYGNYLAKKLD